MMTAGDKSLYIWVVLFLINLAYPVRSEYQQYFPEDASQQISSGLYIVNPKQYGLNYKKATVPLKLIHYDIKIVNALAHIQVQQKYQNPIDKYLNVVYSFPINPQSSLFKMVAQFADTVIQGVVKEKNKATKQFYDEKSRGNRAILSYVNSKSKDIMHLYIGNIPPMTQVTIKIQLIQQMTVQSSTFYNLRIPSTISPRYMNLVENKTRDQSPNDNLKHQQFIGVDNETAIQDQADLYSFLSFTPSYKWNLKLTLKSDKRITYFRSPTHPMMQIDYDYSDQQKVLSFQASQPSKDFNFLYTTQNFHLPSFVVGRSENSYTIMASFIPKYIQVDVNSYNNVQQTIPQQYEWNSLRGQFIFILDRSGSMEGQRVQKAKQALIVFLKSLPQDSYFNIISFGSKYQFMYDKSQKYQNNVLNQAVQNIQVMQANMGGTQIFQPLYKAITSSRQIAQNYPKTIFLLTDGDVTNTEGVIKMAKKKSRSYNVRIYTIGIGNGASFRLIKGCAEAGRGKYVMISDRSDPAQKIIGLLQSALVPFVQSVSLTYEYENLQSMIPDPANKLTFLKDDAVNIYLTYTGQFDSPKFISLQYLDVLNLKPYKAQMTIQPDSQDFSFVDKMAHFKVLRALQDMAQNQQTGYSSPLLLNTLTQQSFSKQAQKYSIKYQVLSEFTAFIGVQKQNKQNSEYKKVGYKSVIVPQTLPYQYLRMMKVMKYGQSDIDDYQNIADFGLDEQKNSQFKEQKGYTDIVQDSEEMSPKISQKLSNFLRQLLSYQNTDGSWSSQDVINLLVNHLCQENDCNQQQIKQYYNNLINQIKTSELQVENNFVITKIVVQWMKKQQINKSYKLIIKKAENFINNIMKAKNIDDSFFQNISQLFT